MNSAIKKLLNYSRLEAQRGFDNRAVVGGLQNMLEPWEAEARETDLPEAIILLVTSRLRDYPRLSTGSREEILRGLWSRIGRELPEARDAYAPSGELPQSDVYSSTAPTAASAVQSPPPHAEIPAASPDRLTKPVPSTTPPIDAGTKGPAINAAPAQATDGTAPAGSAISSKTPEPTEPLSALNAPLTTISGIGPRSAKTLSKLGLETMGDLLWHLPRRYDDYSQLKTINRLWYGEEVTIIATVDSIHVREIRGGKMKIIEALVSDGTGSIRATWFNQHWITTQLSAGDAVVLSGRVDQYLGKLLLKSPEWELLERQNLHTNRIVPVYALTAGIGQKWLRKVIFAVVDRYARRLEDPLPASIRASAGVAPLQSALQQVHFPDSWEQLREAQQRLSFDEFFLLQLGVIRQKRDWEALETAPFTVEDLWLEQFKAALPYALTNAQTSVLEDLRADLSATKPMNRLLEGDVGAGKTIVAAAAIGITVANQAQAAIMTPTSILAEQHYRTLLNVLPAAAKLAPESIRLLLGATPEAEKDEIRAGLADGSIRVVIGTHALLEDPVSFQRLGFVVIDEQHRFGVEQRARLRAKGSNPHLLVMTATPIPRSLALTIYGDLNLSILDEMPPGRQPVKTQIFMPSERLRAHNFIISQIEQGRQAFIIFPLVEESEKVDAKAAVEEHLALQKGIFQPYKLGLLHGRMKADEKEQIMQSFRQGEFDVLVSTSVVEVGVDIPNATAILIEGANRFGLAQLHQFRGRVGRSDVQSYCLLIPDSDDAVENKRLEVMESTSDGFRLAEMDMELRGPGDFLGTRQSGYLELKAARLSDVALIEKARREAIRLYEDDPKLEKAEHQTLAESFGRFWNTARGEVS